MGSNVCHRVDSIIYLINFDTKRCETDLVPITTLYITKWLKEPSVKWTELSLTKFILFQSCLEKDDSGNYFSISCETEHLHSVLENVFLFTPPTIWAVSALTFSRITGCLLSYGGFSPRTLLGTLGISSFRAGFGAMIEYFRLR